MIKKLFTVSFFAFACMQAQAQMPSTSFEGGLTSNRSSFFDKVALEASYGAAFPLAPTDHIKAGDFTSLVNFQLGANYQFDQVWGVRLTYAYQNFEHKDESKYGITMHKFMAEATYNILTAIEGQAPDKFDLIAHAGIGGTFAESKFDKTSDKMINAQIGIKPTYAVSDRINIFADITGVFSFSQDIGYNGLSTKFEGKDKSTGMYLTTNIGVQVKLGK